MIYLTQRDHALHAFHFKLHTWHLCKVLNHNTQYMTQVLHKQARQEPSRDFKCFLDNCALCLASEGKLIEPF